MLANAETSIGCPVPDLRFIRPRKVVGTTTTEQPYVTFETTQIYLPDDFTTADFEYVEPTDDDESADGDETVAGPTNNQRQTRYTDYNPYAWNNADNSGRSGVNPDDSSATGTIVTHEPSDRNPSLNTKLERRKMMRKNAAGRRRLDRHHQTDHKLQKREIVQQNTSADAIYSIQSSDIVDQLHGNLNSIGSKRNRSITIDLGRTDGTYELRKMNDEDDENSSDGTSSSNEQSPEGKDDVNQSGNYKSSGAAKAIKTSSSSSPSRIAKHFGSKKYSKHTPDMGDDEDTVAEKKKAATTTKKKKKMKMNKKPTATTVKSKKKIALQRTQNTSDEQRVADEINNNSKKNENLRQTLNGDETENDSGDGEGGGGGVGEEENDDDGNHGNDEITAAADNSGVTTIDNYNYRSVHGATDADASSFNGNGTKQLHRVKRKSGKATGALSRPKGGSDSGTKNTSRKKEGKCFVDRHPSIHIIHFERGENQTDNDWISFHFFFFVSLLLLVFTPSLPITLASPSRWPLALLPSVPSSVSVFTFVFRLFRSVRL